MIQTSPAVTRGESAASSASPLTRGSAVPSSSVVALTPGLPAKEMLQRLARASRATDIGNRTLGFYLHEMQVRREYQGLGYATAVHLATERLRIPRTTARELITTGGELLVLKKIDADLCQGEITWSTAKMLCRVAVPDTEEEWLAFGKRLSCRKLEREIAGVEKGRRPRGQRRGLPAQAFDVHTRIDNVQHEMFETARRKLADIIDDHVDNRLLVMTLVEAFLRGELRLGGEEEENDSSKGSPRSHGLLYHLIVQQCPGCRETLLHTGDGPVELPGAKGDAIACEAMIHRVDDAWIARHQGNGTRLSSSKDQLPATARGETEGAAPRCPDEIAHSPHDGAAPWGDAGGAAHLVGDAHLIGDRVDIPTPPWMRTLVLLRDGMKCLCCGSRRNLQAHHGRHRVAEKGITHPINLATTCSTCHEGCHNGNLQMVGDADQGWVFLDREGRPLSEPVKDPDAIQIQIETPIEGGVVSQGLTGGARASGEGSLLRVDLLSLPR